MTRRPMRGYPTELVVVRLNHVSLGRWKLCCLYINHRLDFVSSIQKNFESLSSIARSRCATVNGCIHSSPVNGSLLQVFRVCLLPFFSFPLQ